MRSVAGRRRPLPQGGQEVQREIRGKFHLHRYIVGETKWRELMASLMKPFTSSEVKCFDLAERGEALWRADWH